MTIVRWEPLREISSLQSEMNRLFDTLFDAPRSNGANPNSTPRRWVPAMDLAETEDALVLRADLPGLSQEDVHIEIEDNVLTISGERKADHSDRREGYYRVERAFGQFARSLTLPKGIDAEAISASFENGVLEVTIPKPEAVKPRRVAINVGSAQANGNGNGNGHATIEGTTSS